jgi:hypothetical protein
MTPDISPGSASAGGQQVEQTHCEPVRAEKALQIIKPHHDAYRVQTPVHEFPKRLA